MPFINSCFISHRNGSQNHFQNLVTSFHEALAGQLDLYVRSLSVFIDKENLRGGDLIDRELAAQLCRSVCMILLFDPAYFSLSNPYCAREYKAMLALERKRLSLLPAGATKGLIIPVVFRGERFVPRELSENRLFFSFERILLWPADFKKSRQCLKLVATIADAVYERLRLFHAAGIDPCDDCGSFEIPTASEIHDWLKQVVAPPQATPGR